MREGFVIVAKFFIDPADPVPGVVVTFVSGHTVSVRGECFVVFFITNVFVALECEGVGEFWIQLCCSFEAFEGLFMISS